MAVHPMQQTALVSLNYLWQANLSIDELAKLGLSIRRGCANICIRTGCFAEGVGEKSLIVNLPRNGLLY